MLSVARWEPTKVGKSDKEGVSLEANLEIYRRTLGLFSTIEEAVDYIGEKTREGDFDICIMLS